MKVTHLLTLGLWLGLLVGCGGGSTTTAASSTSTPLAVDRASAGTRWAAIGLPNYRFTLRTVCFCLPEDDIVITVQSGVMVSATYAFSGQAVPASRISTLAATSVEGLLALIDNAATRPADVLNVTYHPNLGYPQSIDIDWSLRAIDDEVLYTVMGFTVL